MNKLNILFAFALIVLVLPMISANLGTFKQGTCVEIKTILNTSAVNISTISYPNSTVAVSNQAMTKTAQTFNYSFCNTNILGVYTYDYFDAEGNVYVNDFEVTETGNSFSQSQIGVIIAFAILTGIFIVIAFAFSKEKWKQRGAFFVLALLMGIITINSVRVLAQGSPVLSLMASVALWVTIIAASFMFLYLLVYYTREIIKSFKQKKENRWNSENVM